MRTDKNSMCTVQLRQHPRMYSHNANTPSQNYIWISQNKRTAHIVSIHTTVSSVYTKTLRMLFCYCYAEYNYRRVVGSMALNKICTSH